MAANLPITGSVKDIILADDNLEQCFYFRKTLKQFYPAINYTEVNDGEALLKLLESYIPDLLFLDLDMPCKNGIECLKHIRSQPVYDNLPIVIYSISKRNTTIQTTYGLGANLYFIKPPEYTALQSSLEKILSMDWENPKSITQSYYSDNKYRAFQNQ